MDRYDHIEAAVTFVATRAALGEGSFVLDDDTSLVWLADDQGALAWSLQLCREGPPRDAAEFGARYARREAERPPALRRSSPGRRSARGVRRIDRALTPLRLPIVINAKTVAVIVDIGERKFSPPRQRLITSQSRAARDLSFRCIVFAQPAVT